MAKRKKIKASSSKKGNQPECKVDAPIPADNGLAPKAEAKNGIEPQKMQPKPSSQEQIGQACAKSGCRVSLPTFIGGMFLTLVLGLYVGTLLPGIMGQEKVEPAETSPAQQRETPAQPELDAHLKHTLADLEKRAAANPDSAPDWINLGNIYFDAHMPEKAIQAYEHALRLAPGNADVLTDMGIMHREKGDYAKAVEAFRKAIEVDPRHQNAMFNEGIVLLNDLRKKTEAAAAWQRLLDINPDAKAPNGTPLAEMIRQLR